VTPTDGFAATSLKEGGSKAPSLKELSAKLTEDDKAPSLRELAPQVTEGV